MSELEDEITSIGEAALRDWVRDVSITASMFKITQGEPEGVMVDIRPALLSCGIDVEAIPQDQFQLVYHFMEYEDGYWVEDVTDNGGEFYSLLQGLASAFLTQFGDMMNDGDD